MLFVAVFAAVVCQFAACSVGGLSGDRTFTFQTDSAGFEPFVLTAGEPLRQQGQFTINTGAAVVSRGNISVNMDNVTFTPSDSESAKALQAGATIIVTFWIDGFSDVDTVCDTGDEYGPYTITLGADAMPASITPNSVDLEPSTVLVLRTGQFSVCVEVESSIGGTVAIGTFTLGVSVETDS